MSCQHHHQRHQNTNQPSRETKKSPVIVDALNHNPDVATIERTKVMVSLYTLTGCDFTSFFVGHGKAIFLQTFFKYTNFISDESPNLPGSLADVHDQACFLSFLRLVCIVTSYEPCGLSTTGRSQQTIPSLYHQLKIWLEEEQWYSIP